MRRAGIGIAAAAAVLLAFAAVADADMLQLKDGRIFEGMKMAKEADGIRLHFRNGEVVVPFAQIDDWVIEGVPPFEPRTEDEKSKRAEGLVPFHDRWVKPDVREREIQKEIEEKRAALEEYKKHDSWDTPDTPYEFETRHFKFQSVCPPRINEYYSDLLETYFEEFSDLWKVRTPRDWGKLRVVFHNNRKAFHDRAGAGGGTLAYYRFVEPRELNFYYDGKDPDRTAAVLFHEANHYLTDLLGETFQHPHWVNEAMAEYYGATTFDPVKEKVVVGGIQEGRLVEVLSDIDGGKWMNVKELVSSEERAYEHYYWGWSFVHFLMEDRQYQKRFRAFFSDLARARDVKRQPWQMSFESVSGEECLRVFMSRMGLRDDRDIEELQKKWYEHIKSLDCSQVTGLEKAGIEAFRQGRIKFRASRLLKEAIEKGSTNVQAYFHYSQCLQFKGDEKGALEMLEKACELEPLEPDAWAYRGFLLIQMDEKEKGEKMIALAKEIDPDRDYLNLEVARKLAEVMGGGD